MIQVWSQVPFFCTGALPDLFREGQGIVVVGTQSGSGRVDAIQVLAKHDENYIPAS